MSFAIRIPRLSVTSVVVALTVLALLLAACTPARTGQQGQPARSAGQQEVRIVTTEWGFAPNKIAVPAGESVTFVLENQGKVEHDIKIAALGVHVHAQPGQTAKQTVKVDKPGTYEFECTLPGHKQAGMTGVLTVGAGAASGVSGAASVQTSSQPQTQGAGGQTIAALSRLPQPQVAPPINRTEPALVKVDLEVREVTALVDDGIAYTFWTFGGTVPGPMIRVRQGDTVELTLRNAPDSRVTHSIDLHAVTGPGGGAKVTQIPPGQSATFRFKALNPGVYVYHCATPMVAHHIASGMYGLIVVEPPEGLPKVDREFYVMQGDLYLQGARTDPGLRSVSIEKLLDERPDYVLFNGSVGGLTKESPLKAKVGETVRVFFGVGGPNLTSSFHVIGEIFDRVYPEGASEPLTNVQTTLVPAGGATIADFKLQMPGTYVLVDHSLGRLEKGAAAYLMVEGPEAEQVFQTVQTPAGAASAAAGH